MCGFAGIVRPTPGGIDTNVLLRMAAALRHRGPDGYGVYAGARVGLAHVRLSIIDIEGGAQPLRNEDGRLTIVYNGEIYNYRELRAELETRGHRFRTRSDTEVLVHAYEQWGVGALDRLEGQFAFAVHDRTTDDVFLARDRFGVRPLLYTERDGTVVFGSEAKALFASGEIAPELDLAGLDQVFTFWAARPPQTVFRGIRALEPGTCAIIRAGRVHVTRYYDLQYQDASEEPADVLQQLDRLLNDSARVRLQADVPVGGYLSGGIDSAVACHLATRNSTNAFETFSVAFDDQYLDERAFQQAAADALHTSHHMLPIGPGDIAAVFPEVIRHAETPVTRTAPAPMFLLSRLTRSANIKVVLTGEGADEFFLGYDLFKEAAIRRFCARQPESTWRPMLLDRLYAYMPGRERGGAAWRRFFLNAGTPGDPLFSHMPRFLLTSRIKEFYSPAVRDALDGRDALEDLRDALPPDFPTWDPLNRAAYLELVTLLEPYLLASQGDRMAMAHGVEGRFPYLHHRLFTFTAGLPTRTKLRGLREKDILRRWAASALPKVIYDRPKHPYRAPDAPAFFGDQPVDYVEDLLDSAAILRMGIFEPRAVAGLVKRCRAGRAKGVRENQALVAILSTQLWIRCFLENGTSLAPLDADAADVLLDERQHASV